MVDTDGFHGCMFGGDRLLFLLLSEIDNGFDVMPLDNVCELFRRHGAGFIDFPFGDRHQAIIDMHLVQIDGRRNQGDGADDKAGDFKGRFIIG